MRRERQLGIEYGTEIFELTYVIDAVSINADVWCTRTHLTVEQYPVRLLDIDPQV